MSSENEPQRISRLISLDHSFFHLAHVSFRFSAKKDDAAMKAAFALSLLYELMHVSRLYLSQTFSEEKSQFYALAHKLIKLASLTKTNKQMLDGGRRRFHREASEDEGRAAPAEMLRRQAGHQGCRRRR
jgi:hypothetical protein